MDKKTVIDETMKNINEAEIIISEQLRIINEYVIHINLLKKIVTKYSKTDLTEDQHKQMLENLYQTTQLLSDIKNQ
jgi:hypothetical protein